MIPEALISKIDAKKIPIDAQFELTWRCNQRCIHCYQFPSDNDELSTQEIKDIIAQLAEAGTLYISFTGGEPLLRADFWQIAEFASKAHFALTLQTNATLIDRKAAERLSELNFFAVHISFLGATARTHDRITQTPGSFKKMLKAIKFLQKSAVKVILNVTLMKQNLKEFGQMLKLKERFGENVDIRVSPYIFPRNDGTSYNEGLRLDNTELRELFLKVKKESGRNPWEGGSQICTLGKNTCTINPKAEVYPCVTVPLVVGNLKRQRFKKIWHENSCLEKIRDTQMEDLTDCQGCGLTDYCFRCSGMAYLETGNICKADSESCRFSSILKEVNSYE